MFLRLPKNNERIFWTKHAKEKMRQYQLSEKRVLCILRKPDRKEEGIAPGTIAHIQVTGTKKHPTEAWLMYQIEKIKNQKPSLAKARRGGRRERSSLRPSNIKMTNQNVKCFKSF